MIQKNELLPDGEGVMMDKNGVCYSDDGQQKLGIFVDLTTKHEYCYCDHCHKRIDMDTEDDYEETGSGGRTEYFQYFMHHECMKNYS